MSLSLKVTNKLMIFAFSFILMSLFLSLSVLGATNATDENGNPLRFNTDYYIHAYWNPSAGSSSIAGLTVERQSDGLFGHYDYVIAKSPRTTFRFLPADGSTSNYNIIGYNDNVIIRSTYYNFTGDRYWASSNAGTDVNDIFLGSMSRADMFRLSHFNSDDSFNTEISIGTSGYFIPLSIKPSTRVLSSQSANRVPVAFDIRLVQ